MLGSPGQPDHLFPAEVVELLRLEGIDYAQLRRLFHLVKEQAGEHVQGREWARYTLLDVAALEVLISLCGGREALGPGRRLRLANIREACSALRSQGFSNPLLQVPMAKIGRNVYAVVQKVVIEPRSGQVVMDQLNDPIKKYFAESDADGFPSIRSLSKELAHLRSAPDLLHLTDAIVHLSDERLAVSGEIRHVHSFSSRCCTGRSIIPPELSGTVSGSSRAAARSTQVGGRRSSAGSPLGAPGIHTGD